MHILPSGTDALLVDLDTLDDVLALYAALTASRVEGVLDVVPAARTVLVVVDPAVISLSAAEAQVRNTTLTDAAPTGDELVTVPVIYDGEDLRQVAELLGSDAEEVVRRHTESEWRVAFCGFMPGFGYLTSTDWAADVPRLPSPRNKVPAGSVALAGEFSGVYPRVSPGGWQLIGRTDLHVFDLSREPAALLRPGTRVRFVEATRS